MIYDRLENAGLYFDEESPFYKAICFARDNAAQQIDGTHELDGKRLKAGISAYRTEPAEERRFEAHRVYADLQVVLEGAERQDSCVRSDLVEVEAYDAQEDLVFFETPERFNTICLEPGFFAVYFPHDAHRPSCAVDGSPSSVRKVCMKVMV